MNYQDMFQRNIGLFTQTEQDRLQKSKVAIAGVGGVGSYQAVALARFGVGELSIMDPGIFDPPDMNRQYGAMSSTMDQNKAEATAKLLKDINPLLKINVFTESARSESDVDAFIEGADLVIDAIDYAVFYYKYLLHKQARQAGKYILSGPIPGFGATLQIFSPTGMTIETFYMAPEDKTLWDQFKLPLSVTAPQEAIPEALHQFVNGELPYLSTNAASAQLAGALLGMEAALMISGKRLASELIVVPDIVYLDLLTREYRVFNPYPVEEK
jgi:molybdopterin/thiamine biosynthesis adenylyltransferase